MLSDQAGRVGQSAPRQSARKRRAPEQHLANRQAPSRPARKPTTPNPNEEAAELSASGLFDDVWYLNAYPDVATAGVDPVLHFCQFGWIEYRQPNPWFDTAWYFEQPNIDHANPLLHYVRQGEAEGRRPTRLFDPAWYRAAHDLPPGTQPLRHFLAHRHAGQFAPDPTLYAVPYLPHYNADDDDPYLHYLQDMEKQGQQPFPDPAIITASGLLDPNYYLINGTDVHQAQLDPILHFCQYGWKERRNPNLYFNTDWYLRTNPSVARLGINPVLHYVLQGEAANRRPIVYFDPDWYRTTYTVEPTQTALRHFLTHRLGQTVSPTPLFDIIWYIARYPVNLRKNRDPFSHYLQAGLSNDIDPSSNFNAKSYREKHIGRPTRRFGASQPIDLRHPLIHFLQANYR